MERIRYRLTDSDYSRCSYSLLDRDVVLLRMAEAFEKKVIGPPISQEDEVKKLKQQIRRLQKENEDIKRAYQQEQHKQKKKSGILFWLDS